jgi:hypothetical protein
MLQRQNGVKKPHPLGIQVAIGSDENGRVRLSYYRASSEKDESETGTSVLGKRNIREESKLVALAKFDQSVQGILEEAKLSDGDAHMTEPFYNLDDKFYQPPTEKTRLRCTQQPPGTLTDFRTPLEAHISANDSPMMNALTFKKSNFT